jgi:hypothetical protein
MSWSLPGQIEYQLRIYALNGKRRIKPSSQSPSTHRNGLSDESYLRAREALFEHGSAPLGT